MLEDEHPGLEKDPIHRPPLLTESDGNLTEYTNKFIFYITAERLKQREYTEKEQALHYIKGLDISDYQPAISHVNSLLDTWSSPGLNHKCQLPSLPKTISKFFTDNNMSQPTLHSPIIRSLKHKNAANNQSTDTGVLQAILTTLHNRDVNTTSTHTDDAVVRAIINYANNRHGAKKSFTKTTTDTESRKSVDAFCDACGGHGHRWKNCDSLAKMIKCLDYVSTLSDIDKSALLITYNQEQARRRKVKQLATAGHARFLRDAGDIDGLFQLIQDNEGYTFNDLHTDEDE
jgi:hypothetical protein